jgi:hypothetical protein
MKRESEVAPSRPATPDRPEDANDIEQRVLPSPLPSMLKDTCEPIAVSASCADVLDKIPPAAPIPFLPSYVAVAAFAVARTDHRALVISPPLPLNAAVNERMNCIGSLPWDACQGIRLRSLWTASGWVHSPDRSTAQDRSGTLSASYGSVTPAHICT